MFEFGWFWLDAGTLKRPWHRKKVHSFMYPEGE